MSEWSLLVGLRDDEVLRVRDAGGGNTPPPSMTKSTGRIIRDNLCTLFNLFNLLIALALALVGAWSNLLFILVIVLNAVIGIVQELHAKKLVEQIARAHGGRFEIVQNGAHFRGRILLPAGQAQI